MDSNTSKYNIIITISVILIVMCTVLFTLDTEEIMEPERENIQQSVAFQEATTPNDLSKDDEREDICKWAKAQKDYTQSRTSPITAFHKHFEKTTEAWCQMFVNWCSVMAGVSSTNFSRGSFKCSDCLDGYSESRKAGSSATPEKGWLIYESFGSSKPSHVGMCVADKGAQWAHGNYDDGHVRLTTKNYGTFKSYAKPYYRAKVYYNSNLSGATFHGHEYPSVYETWYTEEVSYPLSSSGPTHATETFKYCINNNKPFKDNTMWVRIIIAGIIGLLYYVSFK